MPALADETLSYPVLITIHSSIRTHVTSSRVSRDGVEIQQTMQIMQVQWVAEVCFCRNHTVILPGSNVFNRIRLISRKNEHDRQF